ncbi:MAG: hypothetical protein KF774_14560 [Planctomyces sp.]|nr:hypothetical protein [Planctomyces sp.]
MLLIGDDLLPQTDLSYFAFRVAFCETLERIVLAEQARLSADASFGYLTEVPFLRNVPPRVQLDLLVDTWSGHYDASTVSGSLMDEAVIYAACETAVRVVGADRKAIRRFLRGGPRPLFPVLDEALAASLHALHMDLATEGDFLLISQFQDFPPDEAKVLKERFRLTDAACEPLFEALGRWHVKRDFCIRARGLLTPQEAVKVAGILRISAAAAC